MKPPAPSPSTSPSELPPEWDATVSSAEREQSAVDLVGHITGMPPVRAEPRGRRRALATTLVLLLALAGTVAAVEHLKPVFAPSPAELDQGRRALLALINSSLEDYLRVHGEYPENLADVLPLNLEVRYQRVPGGYETSVGLASGEQLKVKKP